MFCSQCGKQIPDGSRFCNFCGAHQPVNDPNPDPAPRPAGQGGYQDYSTHVNPQGFETLPYNREGYDAQTTNAHVSYQQGAFGAQHDFLQGFASKPPRPKRKWVILAVAAAAVIMLAVFAVWFFACGDSGEAAAENRRTDPRIAANLANWGNCCEAGGYYYIAVPRVGIYRMTEADMQAGDDDAKILLPCFAEDGVTYDFQDLVPVKNRLYYTATGVPDDGSGTTVYQVRVYDTDTQRDYKLFSPAASNLYALNLVGDDLCYNQDGRMILVDTTVKPEKGEACKRESAIRVSAESTILPEAEGVYVPENGGLGLKLVSYENQTIRSFPELQDEVVLPIFEKDGWLYLHKHAEGRTEDGTVIWRMNTASGRIERFMPEEMAQDCVSSMLNWYGDEFYVGVTKQNGDAIFDLELYRMSRDAAETTGQGIHYDETYFDMVLIPIAGDYLFVRTPLTGEAYFEGVYHLPELRSVD